MLTASLNMSVVAFSHLWWDRACGMFTVNSENCLIFFYIQVQTLPFIYYQQSCVVI